MGCERTNRSESRNSSKNLRIYHGEKVSKGRRTIRKQRYSLQPHDLVLFDNQEDYVVGNQNKGSYVKLKNTKKVVNIEKVKPIRHCGGWYQVSA